MIDLRKKSKIWNHLNWKTKKCPESCVICLRRIRSWRNCWLEMDRRRNVRKGKMRNCMRMLRTIRSRCLISWTIDNGSIHKWQAHSLERVLTLTDKRWVSRITSAQKCPPRINKKTADQSPSLDKVLHETA